MAALADVKPTTEEQYDLIKDETRCKELISELEKCIKDTASMSAGVAFGILKGKWATEDRETGSYPLFLYVDEHGRGYVFVGKSYEDTDAMRVFASNDYYVNSGSLIGSHCFEMSNYCVKLGKPMQVIPAEEIRAVKIPEPMGKLFYIQPTLND